MSPLLLEQLIEALRVLPGVGQKTAQRMAYQLLEREREGGQHLAQVFCTAKDILPHVKRVAHLQIAGSARHQLHQTLCALG